MNSVMFPRYVSLMPCIIVTVGGIVKALFVFLSGICSLCPLFSASCSLSDCSVARSVHCSVSVSMAVRAARFEDQVVGEGFEVLCEVPKPIPLLKYHPACISGRSAF